MSKHSKVDISSLWQTQAVKPLRLSTEELRARSDKFSRTIHRRNLREYIAVSLVVVLFSYSAWRDEQVVGKAGAVLTALGAGFVAYQIHKKGGITGHFANGAASIEQGESCLTHYIQQLERQRDLLRSVWSWYLAPLVPGLLLRSAMRWYEVFQGSRSVVIASLGTAAIMIVFVGVGWLNAAAAKEMQKEIEALKQLS